MYVCGRLIALAQIASVGWQQDAKTAPQSCMASMLISFKRSTAVFRITFWRREDMLYDFLQLLASQVEPSVNGTHLKAHVDILPARILFMLADP